MKALLLAGLLAVAALSQAAPDTADLEARIKACPGMAAWQQAMETEGARRKAARKPPTQPSLRAELLARMEVDQRVRMAFIAEQRAPTTAELVAMQQADEANQHWLRELLHAKGFPAAAAVGTDGSNAAFLLVQHASDATLQAEALAAMEPLLAKAEVSRADYALLFDRVQLAQGRPQRYGSQFSTRDGNNVLDPVEDPQGLDARRAAVDLPPLPAYVCVMETAYDLKTDLSALKSP